MKSRPQVPSQVRRKTASQSKQPSMKATSLKGLGSSFASLVAVVALLAACSKKTEATADAKSAKPATEAKAAAQLFPVSSREVIHYILSIRR